MVAGFGSLQEVRQVWTIDDLADAHEVLDVREEAERKAMAPKDNQGWRPR